jgi:predicted nucleic acid-binding protein
LSGYLDASVLLAILLKEAASERVDRFLDAGESLFTVSEFAAAEVASGLSLRVRTGALTAKGAQDHLGKFDSWREISTAEIAIRDADLGLASLFVRRFELGLRAPDALHAAVCRRAGLALVTLDQRLARAGRLLGLEVLVP